MTASIFFRKCAWFTWCSTSGVVIGPGQVWLKAQLANKSRSNFTVHSDKSLRHLTSCHTSILIDSEMPRVLRSMTRFFLRYVKWWSTPKFSAQSIHNNGMFFSKCEVPDNLGNPLCQLAENGFQFLCSKSGWIVMNCECFVALSGWQLRQPVHFAVPSLRATISRCSSPQWLEISARQSHLVFMLFVEKLLRLIICCRKKCLGLAHKRFPREQGLEATISNLSIQEVSHPL